MACKTGKSSKPEKANQPGIRQLMKQSLACLPEKLAGADEGGGVLELPAHHVGPLVQPQRQVAVAANPLRSGLEAADRREVSKQRSCSGGRPRWLQMCCTREQQDEPAGGCKQEGARCRQPLHAHHPRCNHLAQRTTASRSMCSTPHYTRLCIVGIHDGLGCGTDGDGAVQLAAAALGHPGHLPVRTRVAASHL